MERHLFALARKARRNNARIGVSVAQDRISLALVQWERGAARLERCESLQFETPGDPAAAGAALEAARLPRLPVSLVLQGSDYQLALIEAPDVPAAEMRAAARWKLRDTIDFPVDEAVIDLFDLPPQSRGGQGRSMYAIAARRAVIDARSSALGGLPDFDVVDVPELCLRNVASLLPASASGMALIHPGRTSANVVLVRGSTLFFARQMELRSTRVPGPGARTTEAAGIDAASLALELQRSLDYYERHFDQPSITQVTIATCDEPARRLAADLAQESGLKVEVLDLNTVLPGSSLAPAMQSECLLAIGAALRQERTSL